MKIQDGKIVFSSREIAEKMVEKIGYEKIQKMNGGGEIFYEEDNKLVAFKQENKKRIFYATKKLEIFPQDEIPFSQSDIQKVSDIFVSKLDYQIPVDGNYTESVTLHGCGKVWHNNLDEISSDNLPNVVKLDPKPNFDEVVATHIQPIKITADLKKEELYELGRKGPYHRFVPIQNDLNIKWNQHSCQILFDGQDIAKDIIGAIITFNKGNITLRTITLSDSLTTQIDNCIIETDNIYIEATKQTKLLLKRKTDNQLINTDWLFKAELQLSSLDIPILRLEYHG